MTNGSFFSDLRLGLVPLPLKVLDLVVSLPNRILDFFLWLLERLELTFNIVVPFNPFAIQYELFIVLIHPFLLFPFEELVYGLLLREPAGQRLVHSFFELIQLFLTDNSFQSGFGPLVAQSQFGTRAAVLVSYIHPLDLFSPPQPPNFYFTLTGTFALFYSY